MRSPGDARVHESAVLVDGSRSGGHVRQPPRGVPPAERPPARLPAHGVLPVAVSPRRDDAALLTWAAMRHLDRCALPPAGVCAPGPARRSGAQAPAALSRPPSDLDTLVRRAPGQRHALAVVAVLKRRLSTTKGSGFMACLCGRASAIAGRAAQQPTRRHPQDSPRSSPAAPSSASAAPALCAPRGRLSGERRRSATRRAARRGGRRGRTRGPTGLMVGEGADDVGGRGGRRGGWRAARPRRCWAGDTRGARGSRGARPLWCCALGCRRIRRGAVVRCRVRRGPSAPRRGCASARVGGVARPRSSVVFYDAVKYHVHVIVARWPACAGWCRRVGRRPKGPTNRGGCKIIHGSE